MFITCHHVKTPALPYYLFAIMAFRMNDRNLAIGLGLFLCAAAFGMRYAIKDIVRLTEVDSIDKIEGATQPENREDGMFDDMLLEIT